MNPLAIQSVRNIIKNKVYLAATLITVLVAIYQPRAAIALMVNSSRDCSSNAVIQCGALTSSELSQKYGNQASVRTIYHNFGISSSDVNNVDTSAVSGRVTSGGRVIVNGHTVATGAVTAGRENMSGSQAVTANGVTFYTRPTSISFASNSLPAFVVMKNGVFDYAIISSCGNPVKATPIARTKVTAAAPVAVATTPPAVVRSQPQPVYVPNPVPVTTPVAVPTPVPVTTPVAVPTPVAVSAPVVVTPPPQPAALPNTGVGDLFGFGSFVTLLSGTGHFLYKRKFIR
jgi:hypothetical protein